MRRKPGIGKGVLDPAAGRGKFDVQRFFPPEDLEPFVEHFWTVSWGLPRGERHVQETLPYPSVHIVIEPGASEVVGVLTGKFRRVLEGQGRVVSVKLHPGAFRCFVGGSVARFTDRRPPLGEVFDADAGRLEREVFADDDVPRMVSALERFLRSLEPTRDAKAAWVAELVDAVREDRALVRTRELADRAGVTPRSLQRSFQEYVGVGPKWIIQRFRLQEAADALAEGRVLPELAAELGFSDQAHFTRAFRELIGVTPAAYARRNRRLTGSGRRSP